MIILVERDWFILLKQRDNLGRRFFNPIVWILQFSEDSVLHELISWDVYVKEHDLAKYISLSFRFVH